MTNAKQTAFLNLLFIIINCCWILIIDSNKLYGISIYETFSHNWSYLSPHIATFNIWKVITIALVVAGIFYCILLNKEEELDEALINKIDASGYWMITNQLLLGLSMVFKLNDCLFIAYLCSIGTYYSLTRLNIIFRIRDFKDSSIIHMFTRISLGIYSGWFTYLLAFNGISTLSNLFDLPSNHTLYFYVSMILLVGTFIFITYKTLLCNLPAILAGYNVGVLGSYYFNLTSRNVNEFQLIMRYAFLTVLIISLVIICYLLIAKRRTIIQSKINYNTKN